MGTSIFLAKVLGPYCMIAAVGFFFNRDSVKKVADGFLNNAALKYLGAFFALIIGLIMVNTHNIWEASWVGLITLFGWIALIKGIWLFIAPNESLKKFMDAYQSKSVFLTIELSLSFLIGLLLTFKGYF